MILGIALGGQPCRAQLSSSLRVDQTAYHATCISVPKGEACRYRFTLVARYENRAAVTLYLYRCRPGDRTPKYAIAAIPDSTEDSGYDRFWPCVGGVPPIVVVSRATRVDTLLVEGPNISDGKTGEPLGRLEGEFRLIYEVGTCPRSGDAPCLLPLEQRRSAVFQVTIKR